MTLTGKPLDPRRHTPARPYARQRKHGPSVTTVINGMDKPGLSWGAAKETAIFAVMHRDQWQDLDEAAAIDRLRVHHRGLWDGRAAMGTLVHAINEAWTWGNEVDVDEAVHAIATGPRPPKIWQGDEGRVVAEAEPYIDGLERFWTDHMPVTIATEEVVRHPGTNSYIGQRDWVATLADGKRWLLDIKTTAEQDAEKGMYPDSWRLQLSAYRWAEEIVLYDEKGNEIGTAPNYPVDECGVVHLRGDGGYTLYRLQAGLEEQTRFLQLRGLWSWINTESKKPAPEPVAAQQKAAVA